jgi:hypothetical protein
VPLLGVDAGCSVVDEFVAVDEVLEPAASPAFGWLSVPEHARSASVEAIPSIHLVMVVRFLFAACPAVHGQWQEWLSEQDSGFGADGRLRGSVRWHAAE